MFLRRLELRIVLAAVAGESARPRGVFGGVIHGVRKCALPYPGRFEGPADLGVGASFSVKPRAPPPTAHHSEGRCNPRMPGPPAPAHREAAQAGPRPIVDPVVCA